MVFNYGMRTRSIILVGVILGCCLNAGTPERVVGRLSERVVKDVFIVLLGSPISLGTCNL